MRISRVALLASLALAIAAACSDTSATAPSGDKGLLGGDGKPAGTTKPGNPADTGGNPGNPPPSTPPGNTPPPPDTGSTAEPWPRTVIGTLYGVTYTPTGPDSIETELLAGATVRLYKAVDSSPSSEEPPTQLVATTTTNAQGGFTFAALPEGSYKLEVVAPAGSGYLDKSLWFVPQAAVWQMGVSLYRQ